jgi:hypothetical protein
MKCIECDNPADYIYKGNSLCTKHLEYVKTDGLTAKNEYYALLKDYIGSESTLNYFFRITDDIYKLSWNDRARMLQKLNAFVRLNNIPKTIVDSCLGIATKRKQIKLNQIMGMMKTEVDKQLKKTAIETNNDEIFIQIARNS